MAIVSPIPMFDPIIVTVTIGLPAVVVKFGAKSSLLNCGVIVASDPLVMTPR